MKTHPKDDDLAKKQRIDQAIKSYWEEPAHAWLKNEYEKIRTRYERCETESKKIALYAAMAPEMPEEEFTKIINELWEKACEGSSDLGYQFYKRTINNLEEIRRLKG